MLMNSASRVDKNAAVFILRELQEKYLAKSKNLLFAFVDLEKTFDRVPRKLIWWAMCKLEVEWWKTSPKSKKVTVL